eukprot:365031-Chlamydomonas_euryale.AAC.8
MHTHHAHTSTAYLSPPPAHMHIPRAHHHGFSFPPRRVLAFCRQRHTVPLQLVQVVLHGLSKVREAGRGREPR